MKNKYQSDILGSLHETAAGLYKIGVISEKEMRDYDQDCLVSSLEATYEGKSIPEQNPIAAYTGPGNRLGNGGNRKVIAAAEGDSH